MRFYALLIVASIAAIAAVPDPIPSAAKKTTLYFPVEVGTKWVYQWDNEQEIREITAVEDKKGAKIVTVSEIGKDNKLSPCEVISVTEQELVLLSQFGKELKPPVCLLKIPCKSGDNWKCDSNWFRGRDVTGANAKVCEIEELEVPSGKFTAICVEREYALNSTSGGYKWKEWFAPGIGRVKMIEYFDGPRGAVLKSFTPGKQ
ncbi:MAG TPA: hypothetical protein VG122_14085 [Gemmata sp.]|jgi:hypothetical protein|nr:hypothetical protein [Gemmata sp.]